jgi:ribosomal protein S17
LCKYILFNYKKFNSAYKKTAQTGIKGYIGTFVANSGRSQSVTVFQCRPLSAKKAAGGFRRAGIQGLT